MIFKAAPEIPVTSDETRSCLNERKDTRSGLLLYIRYKFSCLAGAIWGVYFFHHTPTEPCIAASQINTTPVGSCRGIKEINDSRADSYIPMNFFLNTLAGFYRGANLFLKGIAETCASLQDSGRRRSYTSKS